MFSTPQWPADERQQGDRVHWPAEDVVAHGALLALAGSGAFPTRLDQAAQVGPPIGYRPPT